MRARKFQKNRKNLKTPFRHYFQPKWDEIGGEREKKILDPNFVQTRPVKENSKKNIKIIQKIKKPLSVIIFSQNGMRQAKKEKKILDLNSVHTRPAEENSEKNSKKIQKIKKTLSGIISRPNGMRQAEKEKKKIVPNSVHTRPEQENCEKKQKKNQKIKKTLSGIIFTQNGMRQAEKARTNFQSRIPFILGPGKKILKKIAKKFKN